MTLFTSIRRELAGAYRSLRYDLRERLAYRRSATDAEFPEYDMYARRARRRPAFIGLVALLAAAGVAATYFALAGGLGRLIIGPPDGGSSDDGRGTVAAAPAPGPTTGPAPARRPHARRATGSTGHSHPSTGSPAPIDRAGDDTGPTRTKHRGTHPTPSTSPATPGPPRTSASPPSGRPSPPPDPSPSTSPVNPSPSTSAAPTGAPHRRTSSTLRATAA